MKTTKDFKINDQVNFQFLGEKMVGIVTNKNDKDNKLIVSVGNITYQIKLSEKEPQFCSLI
jgi:hypothetical protein